MKTPMSNRQVNTNDAWSTVAVVHTSARPSQKEKGSSINNIV